MTNGSKPHQSREATTKETKVRPETTGGTKSERLPKKLPARPTRQA